MRGNDKYPQSGVVPVREGTEGTEVLLITNRSGERWIFPKGLVEEYLTPRESAQKEAYEEAGIAGVVGEKVGEYEYEKWGGVCEVDMFLLEEVREFAHWPEDFRERRWVALDEELKSIVPEELVPIVDRLLLIISDVRA